MEKQGNGNIPNRLFHKKSECCGCEACAEACPKGLIKMEADPEGFMYPHIYHSELCIHCKRCERVCPIKNTREVIGFREKAIAGYSKKQDEIKASASGSLATAISKGFIQELHGAVYGVAYTSDFLGAEYRRATTFEELECFRTSKYIQAQKNGIFRSVQDDLINGINVLYIGLPCETYALQLFLGKKHDNLYICSLICHGPSSPEVQRQYIERTKSHHGEVESFSVRYKKEGWKPYYIRTIFKNGDECVERFDKSIYGSAFLYFKRPSCNVCDIKRSKIHSDLTIGDYHLAAGGAHKPYNKDGVSSAILHTEKGRHLASIAKDFYFIEIPIRNAMYSEAYHRCISARKNREEYGRVFAKEGLEAACRIKSIKIIEIQLKIRFFIKTCGARVKRLLAFK